MQHDYLIAQEPDIAKHCIRDGKLIGDEKNKCRRINGYSRERITSEPEAE